MKKLLFTVIFTALAVTGFSQERIDASPETLSEKSQEITKALFWRQNSKTGKWVWVRNNTRPYLGEGVHSDNFNNIFIGEYKGQRYLFLDFWEGQWRYPNLEQEWMYFRYILAGTLNDEQYTALKEIQNGDSYTAMPDFYNKMYKGHKEYSPSFFLTLTETLRNSEDKEIPINLITVKRTTSEGRDIIRFLVYPHGGATLIDFNYFEITYEEYKKLFQSDKTTKFK